MVPVREKYQTAVDYCFCGLIHKLNRDIEELTAEMHEIKKVPIEMKDQALNGKYSTSVINFVTEFKRVGATLRIH